MQYFKKELIQQADSGNIEAKSELEKAKQKYLIEFEKACKRLPNEFVRIYKDNHGFHDADLPKISFLTECPGLSPNPSKGYPTKVQLMIVDCDDLDKKWAIELELLKEARMNFSIINNEQAARIEDYVYDEILIYNKDYLSWEILTRTGELLFIFKRLSIRVLYKYGMEGLL